MARAKQHSKVATNAVTSTEVLAAVGSRGSTLMLENKSIVAAEIIWVNIAGEDAVVGEGIPLGPRGYITFSGDDCPSQAVSAISESGTPSILITRG